MEVLGRRSDGYHELRTLYQTVDLKDYLHFATARRGISLRVDGPDLGPIRDNLVYQAARLFARRFRIRSGASMRLVKNIPAGAGLGGGSSNAAVTLMGLNRLWDVGAGLAELMPLAARLGSDVAFFLVGGTAVGVGRGEHLFPSAAPAFRWLLIVDPQVHVSTRKAYALLRRPLTSGAGAGKISRLCLLLSSGPWGATRGFNDFERPILRRFPGIRKVKEALLEHGALAAHISGSGSAVYGIFPDRKRAQWALSRIEQHPWKAYLVKTVDQASYKRALHSL